MERILILEADQQFAAELERALRAQYAQETSTAPTVREACLLLAQKPYDLAFVPHQDLENISRALQSLQPDLPLVALIADKEKAVGRNLPEAVKGTLVKTEMARTLAPLMYSVGQSLSPPPTNGAVGAAQEGEGAPGPETPSTEVEARAEPTSTEILPLLRQITGQEKVLGALISRHDRLLAHNGGLDEAQAAAIRQRITTTWRANNSALIQFMRLADRSGDLLLFTRPIRGEYLLTVAALPDLHLGQLRKKTDEPVRQLSSLVEGKARPSSRAAVVATNRPLSGESGAGASYALVWRPRQPMPGMLQIALRRALERIAQANECDLRHLIVDAELVHVVVHCPGDHTAARIAHLFKRDAEKEIQQQFGVPAQLWEKGYYAAESDEPLSQAELNLFLGSQAKS